MLVELNEGGFILTGIYCIENMVNHKKYVGKSENLEHRTKSIRKCIENCVEPDWKVRNSYLTNSIKKYGIKNFSIYILEECPPEILSEREKYWISELHTYRGDPLCHGYNLTLGGEGVSGLIMSDESKSKMSISAHTRKYSYSRGQSMSKYMKENNPMHNPEIAKKNADARRGKELSESHRKNIGLSAKGRTPWNKGISTGPQSPELIEKRSKAMIGHSVSEECREKIRESKVGKIAVTKDNKVKYIYKHELPQYEELGYSLTPRVYGKRVYQLKCKNCGNSFEANASNIKLCPKCKSKG